MVKFALMPIKKYTREKQYAANRPDRNVDILRRTPTVPHRRQTPIMLQNQHLCQIRGGRH